MAKWTAFPYPAEHATSAAVVKKNWARLHVGDAEPRPEDAALLDAWALYHSGEFQHAVEAGLALGGAGNTVANRATCIYANYLEKKEKTRLDLYLLVAERAEAQAKAEPDNPSAWFWLAFSLGRYSQGISVAKALALGTGSKVKEALERVIELRPDHADANVALGAFHAEVIDKVGPLIGGMTYGAKKETGLKLFQTALVLNPGSPIAMVEYAHAMVMLEGDQRMKEATRLYEQAAACKPLDAAMRLDIEMAKAALAD
ncbi:MAG: hypothetical protein ABI589_01320 [Burkholderiales bacterium]